MATLKNSTPKKGMSLHKFIAVGGKPKNFQGTPTLFIVQVFVILKFHLAQYPINTPY